MVELFSAQAACDSYPNLLYLRDLWAFSGIQCSVNCPFELADNEPTACIVDNDNFKMDTLTGKAPVANRINVMYVQSETLEKPLNANENDVNLQALSKKTVSDILKQVGGIMQEV